MGKKVKIINGNVLIRKFKQIFTHFPLIVIVYSPELEW